MARHIDAVVHWIAVVANPERWIRAQRTGAVLDTWAGVLTRTVIRLSRLSYWAASRKVHRGLAIPDLRNVSGRIWAVTMVKNEADIIEHTVRHLVSQGVDQILVADNGSSDATIEILRRLKTTLPLHIAIDSEHGYFQDHKMSTLAKIARRHGAEWVIPFDADEFWFAPGQSLRNFLIESNVPVLRARMFNIFPTRDRQTLTGMTGPVSLDMSSPIQEKVAVRTHPLLWIEMGNHGAIRPGFRQDGLRIIHAPWRSRPQLTRKIRQGAEAYRNLGRASSLGTHWTTQDQRSDEGLGELWSSLLDRRAPASLNWRPHGPFVTCDPSEWRFWDPDVVVDEDVPRYQSWTPSE